MKSVLLLMVMLVAAPAFSQKTFPEPPENLPMISYFDGSSFIALNKDYGLTDEGFELYVNLETNHLSLLIDSLTAGWPMPNLRHLQISWNISPDETDSAKSIVIRRVVSQINRLAQIKATSKLESLSFWVGEGLFMTSRDKVEYFSRKGQKENLARAHNALQSELAKLPFKLKVYSTSWGW